MSQSLDQALAKTKSKKTVWALAIVLVALGGVGTYYWTQQKTVQPQYRTVKPKIGAMEVQVLRTVRYTQSAKFRLVRNCLGRCVLFMSM